MGFREGQRGFEKVRGFHSAKEGHWFSKTPAKDSRFLRRSGFFFPFVSSLAYLKMAGSKMCT